MTATMTLRLVLAPVLLAAALVFAACGDDDPTGAATTVAAPAGAALQLTFWPKGKDDPGAEAERSTVNCPPDPDDEGCRALLDLGADAFAETPADQGCTFIYGGPETLEVQGVIASATVSTTITRTNGCEIARWDAVAPLLLRLAEPMG